LTPALSALRRAKTPEELDAMRRAGRAGALAMIEAMRSTRPGLGEWELESLMTWFHVREGAAGPAYQAIAGSGPNSLVLHYSACNRRLQPGEVILIDYAPEVDHNVCDVTRTWPVDGKFTPRQAELYDAVLAAQKAGIAAVRPGVTLKDIEAACRAEIETRGLKGLVRHSACHYIGMEVHDVGDYAAPLVPGVCFTVEPGLYEQETGIGIRIEDVVIVTETGCEVVSAAAPRERDEIERLMAERGVLDLLVAR
jgi:Xaa-Pro aminopeptidase